MMYSSLSRAWAPLFMAIALSSVSSAPAMARDDTDKKATAGELVPVGDPVSCISPRQIRSTRIVDDKTIDFEMTGGTVYRNTLPYGCPGLKFEERFAYRIVTSQLCSIDIITVLQNFGPTFQQGASCGLGPFQKMEKAAR